jgi:hypothetical protein
MAENDAAVDPFCRDGLPVRSGQGSTRRTIGPRLRSAVLQPVGTTTGAFALLRRSVSCLALVTA